MADDVRSARQALGRGATSEALVHLWNAVEPARLAGDTRRLRAIAGMAQRIRAQGDEGEAREAERLLEAVHETVEAGGDAALAPATQRLDADVHAAGEPLDELEPADEETERATRLGNLVWLALVLVIVLINVFGQIRDGL